MALPELKVRVGHDDTKMRKGLSRSEERLQQFAKVASLAANTAKVAFVAATGAIVLGLGKVLVEADKIAKSAQKMGLATQELQRLEHAAGLAGAEFGTLRSGVNLLNRNLALTASGQGAEAERAFSALGISVRNADGSVKSASQALTEISNKFATFEDGVNKSALAMAIFGRSGSELIPLLNQGGAEIDKAKTELEELGAVMSDKLMKNSERFNDNISRLQSAAFGLFVNIGEKLIPVLVNVTDRMVAWVKRNQVAINVGTQLGETLLWMAAKAAQAADLVLNSFQAAYADIEFIWKNFPNVLGASIVGAVNLAITGINKMVAAAKTGINSVIEVANQVLPKFAQINPLDVDAETINKMANPYAAKLETALVGHAERIGKIMGQRTIASLGDALPGDGPPGEQPTRTQAPGFAQNSSKELEALRDKLAGRLQIIRESFMSEAELSKVALEEDLLTLQEALNKKMLTEQEHRSMVEQLEQRHQQTLQNLRDQGNHAMLMGAGQVMGQLGNLLQSYGDKNLKIVKGLSIAQALIAAYTGAAEALKLPYPANIAAFANVLAQGLGAVASIRSVGRGSTGGGAPVGGGGGAGAAAAAVAPAAAAGPSPGTITIEGLRRADIFSGDSVVELMEAMMQKQRDGYNLVIAQ